MRKEYDFSNAKRASEVPHLAKLQAENSKTRISIFIDNDILLAFRARAKTGSKGYQTLINETLRGCIENPEPLDEIVRKVLREELHRITNPITE